MTGDSATTPTADQNPDQEPTLRAQMLAQARLVLLGWWLVVISTAVGLSAGAAVSILTTPQFTSSVTFFIATPSTEVLRAYQGGVFAQRRLQTYQQLLASRALADRVLADTSLPLSPEELTEELTVVADEDSVVLAVRVTDPDPARSLQLARSVARMAPAVVAALETGSDPADPVASLAVIADAELSPAPSAPRTLTNLLLGILFGAPVGVGLALAAGRCSPRVYDPAQVPGVRFIGRLGPRPGLHPEVVRPGDQDELAHIRTAFTFSLGGRADGAVAIADAGGRAGNGTLAVLVSIGRDYAAVGRKVLVVDADLRQSSDRDSQGQVGLADVLSGSIHWSAVARDLDERLSLLPAGRVLPDPGGLMASERFRDLIDEWRASFDLVLIACPPARLSPDARVVASRTGTAVLTIPHGAVTVSDVEEAVRCVGGVVGAILTDVPCPRRGRLGRRRRGTTGQGEAPDPAASMVASRVGDRSVAVPASGLPARDRTPS